MSSHNQLSSAEAEIVNSGDQAGPTLSSEKGVPITPACNPQPCAASPHSLRTMASINQG